MLGIVKQLQQPQQVLLPFFSGASRNGQVHSPDPSVVGLDGIFNLLNTGVDGLDHLGQMTTAQLFAPIPENTSAGLEPFFPDTFKGMFFFIEFV